MPLNFGRCERINLIKFSCALSRKFQTTSVENSNEGDCNLIQFTFFVTLNKTNRFYFGGNTSQKGQKKTSINGLNDQ